MLFGHLLTNSSQIFSDVRTYWSPEAVKRVTGKELTGMASNGIIHLINSGATTLDATGKQRKDGKPAMKPFWEINEKEVEDCLAATNWCPANRDYFRGGLLHFLSEGGACHMSLWQGKGLTGTADCGRVDRGDRSEIHKVLNERTDQTGLPHGLFPG